MGLTTIALSHIVFDAGTQIRAAINEDVVTEYAERMGGGVTFPPVVLFHDGNAYYMADGFHRGLASQRLGLAEIAAEIIPGTQTDALWFALGANKTNGHRLTNPDKKHAVLMAFQVWPDMSGTRIAEQIGCADTYVTRLRDQVRTSANLPDRVTGKDGKSYPSSRSPAASPRALPPEKIAEIERLLREGMPVHEIAKEVKTSVLKVGDIRRSADIDRGLDRSRAAVLDRREQMRALAADGHTSRQIAAELGLSEDGCRVKLRKEGIDVPADRVSGGLRHHDSNRIVDHIVMDAENLTADQNLIEFSTLDRERLGHWVDALVAAKRSLDGFIRRLTKEHSKHGQAA